SALEQPFHMAGLKRSTDGRHGANPLQKCGRPENGRPAQAVADQQLRSSVFLLEPPSGSAQVFHVRRKRRVLEIAVGVSEPRKIETQHADPLSREGSAHATCCRHVLGARATMRKERGRSLYPLPPFEAPRQLEAPAADELHLVCHAYSASKPTRV